MSVDVGSDYKPPIYIDKRSLNIFAKSDQQLESSTIIFELNIFRCSTDNVTSCMALIFVPNTPVHIIISKAKSIWASENGSFIHCSEKSIRINQPGHSGDVHERRLLSASVLPLVWSNAILNLD
jgi:hypothetical protein